MATLSTIVGQTRAVETLRRAVAADRLAGALLFVGCDGVGKATTAKALARELCCDEGAPDRCAPCRACARIEAGTHPDVISITADGAFIKVEQVRELHVRLLGRPHEAARRVVIVDPADRMNPAAQNALLKALEEPRLDTHIVLVTAAPHRLLPTVLSRCQRLVFLPLQPADIETALQSLGVAPGPTRTAAASLCEGSVGKAVGLLEGETLARRLEAVQALERAAWQMSGKPVAAEVFDAVARLGNDRLEVEAILEILRARCRDAALQSPETRALSVRRAHAVTRAMEDVAANVNVSLALEHMAMQMGAPA